MAERVGRMISVEVGVADEAAGAGIAELMMGESSPVSGCERAITDGSVLRYLRAFSVPESVEAQRCAVWVDFGITYDENAEADSIVKWLLRTLKTYEGPIVLRIDTTEIPIDEGALSALIREKVRQSV